MAFCICKSCGGNLQVEENVTVGTCEFCGTTQTLPLANDDKKMTLFVRANRLRFSCEFDKASGVYESIVAEFPEEAEAYWGLILCKFGIEYVDDPKTGKKIPTCHRTSFENVLEDPDFDMVMENASPMSKKLYREEAKRIEELRRDIVETSSKEDPYDIFICYKETDPNGERTVDSLIAQDVYDALTERGYRVFFARVTLEDKLGQMYEPYIFSALQSAKIMLAFGTDYEYYNAVWVKNEWSRFLQLIEKGEKKTLIPCYKNIDAYDIPKEFTKLQAQDMGKVGAIQDLLRGIEKILPRKDAKTKETVVISESAGNTAALLKRAFMFLEDGDFENADEFCEKVLNNDPENARAYLGKLMASLRVKQQEDLKNCTTPFDKNGNYKKALRFGDSALKGFLTDAVALAKARSKEEQIKGIYQYACKLMEQGSYEDAAKQFAAIGGYKDAAELEQKCPELRKENVYQNACELMRQHAYEAAMEQFATIGGYKDAAMLKKECTELTKKLQKRERKIIIISTISAILVLLCVIFVVVPFIAMANGTYNLYVNIYNVKELTIKDGVTEIRTSAFKGCKKLESVTIPDSVTGIGNSAFEGCSSLTSITIPDSVTSIGEDAFWGCSSLTSITIPDSVTSIGDWAFSYCSSLTSVTIGNSVTSIGDWAFSDCSSLTSITIPDSVTSIGDRAFSGCSSLTSLYYGGTASEWNGISIYSSNSELKNATRYYYSETRPTESGNYWHYVNGVPTAW